MNTIKSEPKVIYIFAVSHIASGVFDSHVATLAMKLSRKMNEAKIHLICYTDNSKDESEKIKGIAKNISGKIYLLPRNINIIRTFLKLRHFLPRDETFILHAQNYSCSFLAALLKKSRPKMLLYVDLKGIVPEESLFFSDKPLFLRILKYVAAKVMPHIFLPEADCVSTVSAKFRDYIRAKYRYNKPIVVFPSIRDEERFFISPEIRSDYRKKLGLSPSDILICYSGRFQKWQNIEYFVRLIKENPFSEIHFLILSLETQASFLARFSLQTKKHHIHWATGNQEVVNRYLNAADYGFLIRKKNIINQVASPTKLCEYVATSVRVLISPEIGDFSDEVAYNDLGLIVESGTDPREVFSRVTADFNHQRENTDDRERFLHKYSWIPNMRLLINQYNSLFR